MAHCASVCRLVLLWWILPPVAQNTTGSVPDCIPTLTVPRNTVWSAAPKRSLKINCTVSIHSHCWGVVALSWCKLDDMNNCKALNHTSHSTTEWKNITEDTRISFLVLRNLSDEDSGLYRCRADAYVSTVSHNINVTVTDCITPTDYVETEVERNQSKTNETQSEPKVWGFLWPSVYVCSGVLVVVVTVTLGSLLIFKCQRPKKSKKTRIAGNQSQLNNLPLPTNDTNNYQHGNTHSLPPQLSPFCIYDNPPARASSHRDRRSSGRHPANHVDPGKKHDQDNVKEEEEENLVVYASLNHKVMLRGPIRVTHAELEGSEYAAIKMS